MVGVTAWTICPSFLGGSTWFFLMGASVAQRLIRLSEAAVQHYVNLAIYSAFYALPSVFYRSFSKTFFLSDTFGEKILSPVTSFTESVVAATFDEIRLSTMTSFTEGATKYAR